ncbi:hypothetical protein NDU88_005087 [Pleurodeles waltl]|uniref:TIR domain-containing protein n=1 Tax=Pleurodeles waltl TaxID=8319 RepID=A0AAV7PED0_PLEWA|nr:hypothetical protein NDU88_005087 [Pleurodeles waltl]
MACRNRFITQLWLVAQLSKRKYVLEQQTSTPSQERHTRVSTEGDRPKASKSLRRRWKATAFGLPFRGSCEGKNANIQLSLHVWWQVAYAYYLFLAFLYDKKQKRKSDSKYTYDAFVSYNRHDEEWVMRDLLPTLEEQYHWKLCLHHRDFQPGKPILDNIVENIYASRKTICIISEQYLGSEWCSSEMQVASFRLFDERKDVLILIFLQEIPKERLSPYHRMRKLVKRKTYLRWPQKREEVQLFWHKVNMALKTLDDGGENNPILRGTIPYDL